METNEVAVAESELVQQEVEGDVVADDLMEEISIDGMCGVY